MVKIIACGIMRHELEFLLKEHDIDTGYIDAALHIDENRLAGALTGKLKDAGGNVAVVIGAHCHTDMAGIIAAHNSRLINAASCIEMLLGSEEKARLDAEANTFYLTSGWLEQWRAIFIDGQKWDAVDARQNFGYYDRILLLDTGIAPVNDEKILEFYEYTQVPIEIMPVDLRHLNKLLEELIDQNEPKG